MAKNKKKSNKYFSVRRYWTVCDTVVVKADNAEEANEIAMDEPLGEDTSYIEDSMNNDPSVDVTEFEVIDGEKA
jgi:hypothetical protein